MKFVSRGALRPTASKVREALFAILRERLPGASFLDLYAGVGAVGIEALAHGVERVVLVESDPAAVRVLRQNLRGAEAADRAVVMARPAVPAIHRMAGQHFNVIFLDPPYGSGEVPRALEAVARAALLAPGGIAIAEHHHKDPVPEGCRTLVRVRLSRYGETALSFFEEEPPAS